MSISFRCPACGKGFTVGEGLAGKKGKCKHCGGPISVPARPTPPPPADLYDLEEEPAALPPRAVTARPATVEDGPRPRGGSGRKKKRSSSDGSKSKGFFAGIGGSGIVLVIIALRLFSAGHRAARRDGPPPVEPAPSAFVGAPARASTQPWTLPALPERGAMREIQQGVTFQEIQIGPGHPAPGLPPPRTG